MINIDVKHFFEILNKGVSGKTLAFIGFPNITDYTEIEYQFDKLGINEKPRDVKHFFELLDIDAEILDIKNIEEWSKTNYDIVFNCHGSSRFLDQMRIFDCMDKMTKTHGFQIHSLPTLQGHDVEFFSYSQNFFSYFAKSAGYNIEHSFLGNYIMTKYIEFKLTDNVESAHYEQTLGLRYTHTNNWTSMISIGVALRKEEKNV